MEIRLATSGDVGAVQRVAEHSWEHDYPDILSRESIVEGVHEWYSEERLDDEFDRSDAAVLVADRQGEVVGFVHAAWADGADGPSREGDVLRVYVDPDHRGKAVGSALLETAVATLFERDVERIRAMVLAENDPGKAFYRSHGFEREEGSNETEIAGERYEEHSYVLARG